MGRCGGHCGQCRRLTPLKRCCWLCLMGIRREARLTPEILINTFVYNLIATPPGYVIQKTTGAQSSGTPSSVRGRMRWQPTPLITSPRDCRSWQSSPPSFMDMFEKYLKPRLDACDQTLGPGVGMHTVSWPSNFPSIHASTRPPLRSHASLDRLI